MRYDCSQNGGQHTLTPPASSSSGSALATTELFTAPCDGWFGVECTTNNGSAQWWAFTDAGARSDRPRGQMSSISNCTIPINKGEKAYIRGAYVSAINGLWFITMNGTDWEYQ